MLDNDSYEGPGFQIIMFILSLGLVNPPENSLFLYPFLFVWNPRIWVHRHLQARKRGRNYPYFYHVREGGKYLDLGL